MNHKFKQTEIGLIPSDWEAKKLGDLIKLKNGYAFSSDNFSNSGPIVLTPGNFKLNGGLYFNDRNTIRYSGNISKEMVFQNGDLLIVMTDLTPDCNLLGKPGLVNSDEKVLHNQRIGKISIANHSVLKDYLYWFFVSELFSKRMKETATGSTVRHTSVGSINNSKIPLPPTKIEQTAIATALSDADGLITSLEKLIAKKRNIKQGAMQELLRPKEGWVVKKLGEVIEKIIGGGTPSRSNKLYWCGEIPWVTVKDFATFNPCMSQEYITKEGLKNSASHLIPKGTLITSTRMAVGKAIIYQVDVSINQDLKAIFPKSNLDILFLFHWFERNAVSIESLGSGSTVMGISLGELKNIEIAIPSTKVAQLAIATILSDMDTEISILEKKLEKAKQVKQGMMQQLLTGKIRLV